MPKRLTDAERERIVALREEKGWTYAAIAAELGISCGAVQWVCLRAGADSPVGNPKLSPVPTRAKRIRRGGHVVRPFTAGEDAQLLDLEARGKGVTEIARILGRRHNSVAGRLATLARRAARAEDAPWWKREA